MLKRWAMGEYDEKCKKIKEDIHSLINELADDEEYLIRLKSLIKFKVESDTH